MRQRVFDTATASQRVGQAESRFDVRRIARHSRYECLNRGRIVPACLHQHADAEVRARQRRLQPHGLAILFERTIGVALHVVGSAEIETRVGIPRGDLNGFRELLDRSRPIPRVERLCAACFVCGGILQKIRYVRHQRIGRWKIDLATLAQMRFRLLPITHTAICERERIVNAGRARRDAQRRLQVLHCVGKVLTRERGAAEAIQHDARLRLDPACRLQQSLGLVGSIRRETHLGEPHETRQVMGLNRKRAFECPRGLLVAIASPVGVAEVVGPPHV